MSEMSRQVEAVEISIQEAQKQIDRGKQLQRLEKNRDFKALILEGLLREDAVRQVMLRASPQLMVPGAGGETAKAGIEARMTMIGELNNYFRYIAIEAESAEAALLEHEQTHEEMLIEQLAEA